MDVKVKFLQGFVKFD